MTDVLAPHALHSGDALPAIGFGVYKVPSSEAERIVAAALEAGYRHIDTAQVYGNEASVGRAIRAFRTSHPTERVWVTTKLWTDSWLDAKESIASSAALLGPIDLMLLHAPGPVEGRAEAWAALEDAVDAGLVKNIGVSNFGEAHLDKLARTARIRPSVNQLELHPYLQRTALVAACRARGIVVEAYSPLAKGALMGDPIVARVAAKHGVSPARVCVRWSLQHGFVPLPKSATPARIAENRDVSSFALDAEDMAALDALECGRVTGWDPVTQHRV